MIRNSKLKACQLALDECEENQLKSFCASGTSKPNFALRASLGNTSPE
jgi:hypothetical protein